MPYRRHKVTHIRRREALTLAVLEEAVVDHPLNHELNHVPRKRLGSDILTPLVNEIDVHWRASNKTVVPGATKLGRSLVPMYRPRWVASRSQTAAT